MKKKIIQIEIDDITFPQLFNIKQASLGSICYDLFKTGYNYTYADNNVINNNINNNKNLDIHTDSIKYEICKLTNKIDNNDISDKIETFTNIVQDLIGINYNSTKKGKLGEEFIYNIIKNKFKDYAIKITRGIPHSGDAIITLPSKKNDNTKNKIMIEIKNYNSNVDTDELDKLLFDMDHMNIHYSIFLSLKSAFVGKKRLEIKTYNYKSNKNIIIFVPYAIDDPNKIENAIVVMERLIELETENINDHIYDNISNYLQEIGNIYEKINRLKNNFVLMENNINKQLSDHYKSIREYELYTKDTIDKVWKKIQNEFNVYDKNKKIKNTIINKLLTSDDQKLINIIPILEIFEKNNIELIDNNNDIIADQIWGLYKNNSVIGSLMKANNSIEINIFKPINISLNFKNKKKLDNDALVTLNKIL